MRYKEAKMLHASLYEEIKKLKAQNYDPRIRIIGYSHGGNVSLNLAAVQKRESPNQQLAIDELVLLGTPIIADTDYLVNEPIFKRVYNIFSMQDRIQPMDLFAPNQFFSDRIFRSRKGFTLPEKLVQVQLKVTRCRKEVLDCPRRFSLSNNFNNPQVVFGKKNLLRDVSPGHVELWFFGWTPLNYRDSFPLYPLPAISFAPLILHHSRKIAKNLSPEHTVIVDIRPQHNAILFRHNYDQHVRIQEPYIPKEKLELLADAVLQCKPELYSHTIYKSHIQDAVRSAEQILDNCRKKVTAVVAAAKS